MLNKAIKKNVEGTFLDFHGDFDMMSYLDADVPGCSLPQMYFKTSGCWTGGHQENIGMAALNINNGPDASEWYTLDVKYIGNLRNELLHGTSSLNQPTAWISTYRKDFGMSGLSGSYSITTRSSGSCSERTISS
jgi:hypothetical protein